MWYNIYSTLDREVVFILTSAERQQAEAFLGKIRPLFMYRRIYHRKDREKYRV